MLTVGEPRDRGKETVDASPSDCLGGNALDRAACAGGQQWVCVVLFPGIRGREGRERLRDW